MMEPLTCTTPTSPRPYTCLVCLDTFVGGPRRFVFRGCHHLLCTPCATSYFESRLADGNLPIPCPAEGCTVEASADDLAIAGLSSDAIAKFDRWLLQQALESDTAWHCCLTPDCPNGVLWTSDSPVSVFRCELCGHASCLRCNNPEHRGQTCAQYAAARRASGADNGESRLAELVAQGVVQLCLHCGAPTQRDGGCPYMRCRRCNQTWRWTPPGQQAPSFLYRQTRKAVLCAAMAATVGLSGYMLVRPGETSRTIRASRAVLLLEMGVLLYNDFRVPGFRWLSEPTTIGFMWALCFDFLAHACGAKMWGVPRFLVSAFNMFCVGVLAMGASAE